MKTRLIKFLHQEMGFDVLYMTPIHPIGRKNRKGRNNALVAGPGDPGSPYAVGAEEGGHDAVVVVGAVEDAVHQAGGKQAVARASEDDRTAGLD